MTFGLTTAGFVRKTLPDIVGELRAAYRAAFGEDIDVEDSFFEAWIGVNAEREADLWELGEAIYASQYPDTAEGVALRNAVALTGHEALPAAKSRITGATLAGDAATTIPAGSVASVPATGARFATLADVTLDGDGAGTVDLEAEEFGAIAAAVGTLTRIETPISGWESITNPAAASVGRGDEGDADLRARRAAGLAFAKAGQTSAIRAAVLAVFGVTDCTVQSNVDDVTDTAGRPPHSLEVVVTGGDDDAIRAAIWAAKAGGVQTFGAVEGYTTDSEGRTQLVRFSRTTAVPIYVAVALVRNAAYPVDGDARVKAAIVAYGATLGAGAAIANFPLEGALRADASLAAGIDAVTIHHGRSASPATSATLQLDPDERPSFATGNVTVT